jgi:hypothetical protein
VTLSWGRFFERLTYAVGAKQWSDIGAAATASLAGEISAQGNSCITRSLQRGNQARVDTQASRNRAVQPAARRKYRMVAGRKGRIFEKDPITLNPNMTGSEFAAVVTTFPMADQQAITTMVRELMREELDETPPSVA